MKKLCFGTLLILMYQARGQSVTYKRICDAVFTAYGCDGMAVRDKSLPGHLKTGHDNVPPDVVSAARNMPFEEPIAAFEQGVSPLIKETNVKPFIHAIKAVLREDNMPEDTLIGNIAGFEKKDFAFDGAVGAQSHRVLRLHRFFDGFLDLLFEGHVFSFLGVQI